MGSELAMQADTDITALAVETQLLVAMDRAHSLRLFMRYIAGVDPSHMVTASICDFIMQKPAGGAHVLAAFVTDERGLGHLPFFLIAHLAWQRLCRRFCFLMV